MLAIVVFVLASPVIVLTFLTMPGSADTAL